MAARSEEELEESKSGLAGLTRLLANEWAAHGINVNAIVPGYFATNNTAALRADAAFPAQYARSHPSMQGEPVPGNPPVAKP